MSSSRLRRRTSGEGRGQLVNRGARACSRGRRLTDVEREGTKELRLQHAGPARGWIPPLPSERRRMHPNQHVSERAAVPPGPSAAPSPIALPSPPAPHAALRRPPAAPFTPARRKAREQKAYSKQVQAQKTKERAAEKKRQIEAVQQLRKQRQKSVRGRGWSRGPGGGWAVAGWPWKACLFHGFTALARIPYHTIPYHTIPYHTIPYHNIPYHTIPYHTIPYHTIPIYVQVQCHSRFWSQEQAHWTRVLLTVGMHG
jgi:hypothetical protein